jgi:hypothetical protein
LSSLGPRFSGKYYRIYGPFSVGYSDGTFLLEVGIFGFMTILLTHFLILQDARVLARRGSGLAQVIGIAWVSASFVVIAGIFYTTVHQIEVLTYYYWFFSGVVVTERLRLVSEMAGRPSSIVSSNGLSATPRGS